MTTVMVCEHSPINRQELRRELSTISGIVRVTSAASGEEAIARYPIERPDVVLLAVRMPGLGGVESLRTLLADHPDATVLMLTSGEDAEGIGAAVHDGAAGYVVKQASREELAAAITLALSSRTDPVNEVAEATPVTGRSVPKLTDRERQVLSGMSRGLSNAEIGQQLFLSEDTIKTHARRLFRKLDVADRAHAVGEGFRWGLLQ